MATYYDPNSPDEASVALPNAPPIELAAPGATLQPPLSRRGHGPGMIIFLPPASVVPSMSNTRKKPLDPEPQMKWAEEGFAVAAVVCEPAVNQVEGVLRFCIDALVACDKVDIKDKIAVLVYYPPILPLLSDIIVSDARLVCLASYGAMHHQSSIPLLAHVAMDKSIVSTQTNAVVHTYQTPSPFFVLPTSGTYHPGSAAVAHSRTLVFIRKHVGGPHFDIEKVWDEHTYFEFTVRSVAKTMGTMVQEPYVNHVPTMTGGMGRENLTAFYRDHFIFSNPADASLEVISRTVGPDRIIDEFIFRLTHNRVVDWLLPGVPPTGKKLEIPMMSVVNVRGDRLYHEHIWWDQGTVLLQAGLLPIHIDHPEGTLRLPISGADSARLLEDETAGTANIMLGKDWGIIG